MGTDGEKQFACQTMGLHREHAPPALHPEDTERCWMVSLNKSDPSAAVTTEIWVTHMTYSTQPPTNTCGSSKAKQNIDLNGETKPRYMKPQCRGNKTSPVVAGKQEVPEVMPLDRSKKAQGGRNAGAPTMESCSRSSSRVRLVLWSQEYFLLMESCRLRR